MVREKVEVYKLAPNIQHNKMLAYFTIAWTFLENRMAAVKAYSATQY